MAYNSHTDGRLDGTLPTGRTLTPHAPAPSTPVGTAAAAPPHAAYSRPAPAAGRHERAIQSTLEQADEAAANGNYRDALSWLGLIETIGDELPHPYIAKRQAWRAAIGAGRTEP